jgi:hypothetical protein
VVELPEKMTVNRELHALDGANTAQRQQALHTLLAKTTLPPLTLGRHNLHSHSFYSYHCFGWSPQHVAWALREQGCESAALVDFDVLDGAEEFQDACLSLGMRSATHLETRTFLAPYADQVIDSPGETGVSYVLGLGFPRRAQQHARLSTYRLAAEHRNRALVDRINAALPTLALDYTTHVLPLTPSGNATERHLIQAYQMQAKLIMPSPEQHHAFWADVLQFPLSTICSLSQNPANMAEKIRARLTKQGGLGYLQPSKDTFPATRDFLSFVQEAGAIPSDSYLDGTSPGEQKAENLLACTMSQGAQALNLIPDRNWNLKEEKERLLKWKNLQEIVALADRLELPLNIGTELNRPQQPLFDDLDHSPLQEFKASFVRGAAIICGHALLSEYADFSYAGAAADAAFGQDRHTKNNFFQSVGTLPAINLFMSQKLQDMSYPQAYQTIQDSAHQGRWIL